MAAGSLPAPGTKLGPCKKACKHRDCAATREDAAEECLECSKPIGYETLFYRVAPRELIHARCQEIVAERVRKRKEAEGR
jgi:hypothetical protein